MLFAWVGFHGQTEVSGINIENDLPEGGPALAGHLSTRLFSLQLPHAVLESGFGLVFHEDFSSSP